MEFFPESIDAMLSMGWLFLGIVALGHALKWLKESDARYVERQRQKRKQFEQGVKNVLEEAQRQGVSVTLKIEQNNDED